MVAPACREISRINPLSLRAAKRAQLYKILQLSPNDVGGVLRRDTCFGFVPTCVPRGLAAMALANDYLRIVAPLIL